MTPDPEPVMSPDVTMADGGDRHNTAGGSNVDMAARGNVHTMSVDGDGSDGVIIEEPAPTAGNDEYVVEDGFAAVEVAEETPAEKRRKRQEARRAFSLFVIREHREVVILQTVALLSAAIAMAIVLSFHPPHESAFHELRNELGDEALPQPPTWFFLLAGFVCATVAYLWPVLGDDEERRWLRVTMRIAAGIGLAAPALAGGFLMWQDGDPITLVLSAILYGELLFYSIPLPLAVIGILLRKQGIAVASVAIMVGSVFAGIDNTEMDFNLMDPSVTDMALILCFTLALSFFMEGVFIVMRVSTYLETTFGGGTGVPGELDIGRILRTFLGYWFIAAIAAVLTSYGALTYGDVLMELLPETLRSSRELSGVYGEVIFSTLFLLLLLGLRIAFPDLSYRSSRRSADDETAEGSEEAQEKPLTEIYRKVPGKIN